MADNRGVISIDETGITLDSDSQHHYAPQGQKLFSTNRLRKIKNITCIFAACLTRMVQVQYLEGGCNSLVFADSMVNPVEKLKERSDDEQYKRPLILMDNASIHRSKLLTAALDRSGVELLYCPPYCPMLNPVDFANLRLKQAYEKEADWRT